MISPLVAEGRADRELQWHVSPTAHALRYVGRNTSKNKGSKVHRAPNIHCDDSSET